MNATAIFIVILVGILASLLIAYLVLKGGHARFTLDIGGATPRAAGGAQSNPDKSFKGHVRGFQVICGMVIGGLAARLWNMQLISSGEYTEQAEMNRTRTITINAARGRILDRTGELLVGNRPTLVICADAHVKDNPITVKLLANLTGIPEALVRLKIADSLQGAQKPRVLTYDTSRRVVAYINAHPSVFEGITIEDRAVRSYPKQSLCAHVLGYTGTITSEQLKASKDREDQSNIVYEPGDVVGQAGIEAQYENVLQGIKGEQHVHVDADGNVLNKSGSVDAQAGSDVVLTIDAKIQQAAEDSLTSHIARLRDRGRSQCHGGCAIVMDVTNGDIIAMASAPTFSPNMFVGGISNDDWEMLSRESSHNPLMNRSLAGQYPSASTIKPLSALAALNYGVANLDSSYMCTGFWTGFGKQFGQYCWLHSGHGPMGLQSGITYSCDVVFYEIGKGFYQSRDQEGMQKTFRTYGLGSKRNIDLPGEAEGRVPDAQWKEKFFASYPEDARKWQGGDCTNLAIGQGDLLVTPLQMLCAYSALATGGKQMRPHLLKSIKSSSNSGSVIDYKPEVLTEISEQDSYMQMIRQGLLGVVYEESPSQAAHFVNMSEKVAGKTGTAETNKDDPTGWFIAFAPADNPQYVVASVIEDGGFGGDGAIYVVRDILGAIYNEPDRASVSAATKD